MITTQNEFEAETAWERTVLSLAVPVMPLTASGADLDRRTNTITMVVSDSLSAQAVDELRNSLLPLLFGAAWKILDLALELALAIARIAPQNGRRWLINEKSKHAVSHNGRLPGFASSPDIWQALGSLYDGTREARHALVHRRVHVDSSTRTLIGLDDNGARLLPLNYDEQMAFCRFAQRIAQAIIEGVLQPRVEADLRGQLARLQGHHGVTILPTASTGPPVRVIDDLPANRQIDVPRLLAAAQTTFPGAQYIDVELHLEDGRVLAGELECAPKGVVAVDPAAPPAWLRFTGV